MEHTYDYKTIEKVLSELGSLHEKQLIFTHSHSLCFVQVGTKE